MAEKPVRSTGAPATCGTSGPSHIRFLEQF